MSVAFVLGNGVSRKGVDLNALHLHGSIYGCNALYRDYEPDCLVATDRPIAEAIQTSGYSKTHRFYTRRPMPDLGALQVPKQYYGNSSGPIACSIAAMDGHRQIYMLGFDMGPDNQKFNNVYAGTEFYKTPDSLPTFTGNWVKQLIQIAKDFPRHDFYRVCGQSTAEIKDFATVKNMTQLPMSEFMQRINNRQL